MTQWRGTSDMAQLLTIVEPTAESLSIYIH